MRLESVLCLQLARVLDKLIGSAYFTLPGDGIRIAIEEIAGEPHVVAQLTSEQVIHRLIQLLADQIETSEFERRKKLRPVVVQTCGGIRDLETERFELKRIVPLEVGQQPPECGFGAFAAAAHLA